MYGGGFRRTGTSFQEIPVTLSWIGASAVVFLAAFFGMRSPLGEFVLRSLSLWVDPNAPLGPMLRPWTWVTWPIAQPIAQGASGFIGLVFGALWAFSLGGSLERSWGTMRYLGFLAFTSALTALCVWLGALIFRVPVVLDGLLLGLSAPTIAWCVLNRRESVTVYFFPVPAPALAAFTAALTWFWVSMRSSHPLIGAFALAGSAFAWWYADRGRTWLSAYLPGKRPAVANTRFNNFDREVRHDARKSPARPNPIERWKSERERKERDRKLEEMFKRSGMDDKE